MCDTKPEPSPEQAAQRVALCRRLLEDSKNISAAFIAGAVMGHSLREHVDECHPGQVEEAFEKITALQPEGDWRAGWIVGYRFVEKGRET
jgi:hypothetical protein